MYFIKTGCEDGWFGDDCEMCNCRDVYEICISSKQGVKMAGLVMTVKCVTVEMYMKFAPRRQGRVPQVVHTDFKVKAVQVCGNLID